MIIELNEYVSKNWTEETNYLSFSYSVPSKKLITIFQQSQNYKGTRFFWEIPDRNNGFVGIGHVEKYRAKTADELSKAKEKFFKKLLVCPSEKSNPILFGGLPFDFSGSKEPFWGEMEAGFFVLPEILFTMDASKLHVTLTVKALKREEAIQKMMELKEKVSVILEEEIPPVKTTETRMEERDIEHFLSLVAETTAKIKAEKDLKKVVLARQMMLEASSFDPASILSHLLEQQPNTYIFALESEERTFIGATPERLLKASRDDFETASIAGSAPRGKDEGEDREIGESLLKDSKNSYEHQVVVERIQKQLAPFTEEVRTENKRLLKNRDIQHLFVPFKGQRKTDTSFLEVINALHPTPALGGEPKKEALAWIAQKEKKGRGLYGAPIGWVSLTGDIGEFAVGIRSGIFGKEKALLYAGCGIVEESTPEEERNETQLKFQPMIRGVRGK
ncbi:isochorismate synthase [Enterococcus faecalis 13-SD-W-01]|nr:isochorismate synthase [Enterococcus faecalis 13-SD-W-01]